MNANQLLASFSEQQVAGFMLVLARIAPLFILAPLFSSKSIPARARTIVAVAIAFGMAPIALRAGSTHEIPLDDIWTFGGLVVKEFLVGAAFSFVLAALFAAISVAGSLLDTMIGFSFGSLVDPMTGTQSSVLQQLYSLVGVMVFIAINGDAWVLQGLARTYELVPLVDTPQMNGLVGAMQQAFSGIFTAAIQVCAPVLIALVITDAAFGVVSRVVPQLNVFAVGFPAKVAVGFVLIGASLPFVAGWLHDELQHSVAAGLHALRVG
jgi:flagellar biosynthesis protein FliR